MPRTTIKEIARECGVSLSTVSLVLNDNPRISARTRRKVQASVARHQYQPNAFARSLASRSSRSLSVVVPDLNHVFADIYFGEIVSGIYERASDLGYKVVLDIANCRFIANREYLRVLQSRRVDGTLFIGSSVHDEFLFDLESASHAVLVVNHHFPGHTMNHILADYDASARIAAEHLLSLGHRTIGLLAGTNTHTGLEVRDRFTEVCVRSGLAREDVPWADGWFSEQGGYEGAQWLLERHPHLTAIMAGNDKMAIGALRYLHTQSRRVPGDISVMGIDDIHTAAYTNPSLTTVRHDLFGIGRAAVDGLLALFRKDIKSFRELVPGELVVRESTARAPSPSR
jgi:LacI family transcriptional regulator